jgi:imidazolonepropionase-like amidohydrolase
LIDEHSHIAITRGVNEGTRNVTSECDIDDALDCSDINIYRQLSGGVTTSHLLHGSANPIGGQTALIKLRWGATSPFELRFQGADPFIKFALGENVKQSNWGMSPKTRYPQSRMGVEQVYFDAFSRAKEYEAARKKWMASGSKKELEPRPDYTLETLVRILNNKEFITCHSYVQSEINMLMHVADSIGFKVNTFTHVLEGYKVAKELKAHGAYASTFSDWWAYKYEVVDAIPHNAALLTQAGVVTCINSDDAEMARRLNQEAAKTIKYGGLTPVQALATVTLNPAKALHIDGKVGSIEVGKDADLVLWSHNPLSIDAKVEMTLVDGKMAFNKQEDAKNQTRMQAERQRLILKMLEAKKGGKPTSKPVVKEKRLYHCDTIGD